MLVVLHHMTKQTLRQALLPCGPEPRTEEHSNVTQMWQITGQIITTLLFYCHNIYLK
jgi:hypothetical protein